jgi:hypothetical protein
VVLAELVGFKPFPQVMAKQILEVLEMLEAMPYM